MKLSRLHLSLYDFCLIFFETCISHHACENFENYKPWKMYLQVKILTLDIFTHMLPPLPQFPLSPLQSELSFRFYHHPSGDHDLEY